MVNVKIVCPTCGGTKHDIILEDRDGHRIPIGFKCLEPECGWQGPSRRIIWDNGDVINIGSPIRTIGEMSEEAEKRGEWHHTRFKDPSVGKRKRSTGVPRTPKVPEPVVPSIVLQDVKMPSRDLMASTPVTCPTCGQPVVDIWVGLSGELQNIAGKDKPPRYYIPFSGIHLKCSVCGEVIGNDILYDQINLVDVLLKLISPPTECNSCHVTPDKYPITGDLIFTWTGTEWKCAGDTRLLCPGCSSELSIYK